MAERDGDERSGPDGRPWRNFHGRIHGKTLKPRQRELLERDLPALALPASVEENPGRTPLDLDAIFGPRPVWLEIGFGGGEHLVHMARTNPGAGLIGSEPFVNGVAMALGRIREAGVANVRLQAGDVRDLFDLLPPRSIERAFLNYPDPWPKVRHHKRRFVTQGYLRPFRRVLAPGAEVRVATDIESYVEQALKEMAEAGFARIDHPVGEAWPDWPSTRYEKKALREGRRPHYLTFRR